ncbi:hypothetical protein ACO0K9_10070 [Undibacterium sp. Ji50W]|uniref:hypothetical protein n=1 Tax=Undibacterium sp. Ji50W TaxID=3413041 RepID=UPI003BEFC044
MQELKPEFDKAIVRFRVFLLSQGAPGKIVWVAPEHTICCGPDWKIFKDEGIPESLVKEWYQQAKDSELGLRFCLLCKDSETSYCYLYTPVDVEDAEYKLLLNGSLKMSVPSDIPSATVISRGVASVWFRFRELKFRKWKYSAFRMA